MEEKNQVQKTERGDITYEVAGQPVKLSYQIVKDFLVRGNGKVSDQDLTLFISICKYNQFNPFLNEAYLVKYGDSPASIVVSKEAFLKRADTCDAYEGIEGGIIILRDGKPVEVEGCFRMPEEKLLGAWAKVHRSDRKYPTVAKILLDEYDKKQSLWKDKQATMISKVAKVQALREAFPAQLGAMYTEEESGIVDAKFEEIRDSSTKAPVQTINIDAPKEEPKKEEPKEKAQPDNLFKGAPTPY